MRPAPRNRRIRGPQNNVAHTITAQEPGLSCSEVTSKGGLGSMSYELNGDAARSPDALKSLAPGHDVPLAAVALGLLLLWFSLHSLRTLHAVWIENFDYSHGYLILALAAWL